MKAVDLFAGYGGLSLGFQNQGFEIVSTFEWRDSAVKCYQTNFSQPLSSGLYKVLYPLSYGILLCSMRQTKRLNVLPPNIVS